MHVEERPREDTARRWPAVRQATERDLGRNQCGRHLDVGLSASRGSCCMLRFLLCTSVWDGCWQTAGRLSHKPYHGLTSSLTHSEKVQFFWKTHEYSTRRHISPPTPSSSPGLCGTPVGTETKGRARVHSGLCQQRLPTTPLFFQNRFY